MIAIRKISEDGKFRKDMFKSKRKPLEQIWRGDEIIGISSIIRFAPSACNSQPWFVERDASKLTVFRYKMPGKRGIMPAKMVSFYNAIDIGIFLCFLNLCLENAGISYEVKIHTDPCEDVERTLLADYDLKLGETI